MFFFGGGSFCELKIYAKLIVTNYYYYYYYYYCYYFTFPRVFHTPHLLMVYHWNLSDSKSPKSSEFFFNILANLNNAVVWMISPCPLISKSSSSCTNPLMNLLSTLITIGITITFPFHSFCFCCFFFPFSCNV